MSVQLCTFRFCFITKHTACGISAGFAEL